DEVLLEDSGHRLIPVVEGIEDSALSEHELDELPIRVLLEGHEARRPFRSQQIRDEVRAGILMGDVDADLTERLADQGVHSGPQPWGVRHGDREAGLADGIRHQLFGLLEVVAVALVESLVIRVRSRGEYLRGDGAVSESHGFEHGGTVYGVVDGLTRPHIP